MIPFHLPEKFIAHFQHRAAERPNDRIEVASPGTFPGNITAGNIERAGSKVRNPLIGQNLREFPSAPNIDAGEGG